MVRVAKIKQFNIYSDSNGHYIVHNTSKPFEDGHTHINSFGTSKYIINLVLYGRIPKHLSIYLIDSMIRISKSHKYIARLEDFKSEMIKKKSNPE